MNTVTAGEGERPAFGIKSAAGLGCLFIIRDVVVFVDMVRDADIYVDCAAATNVGVPRKRPHYRQRGKLRQLG